MSGSTTPAGLCKDWSSTTCVSWAAVAPRISAIICCAICGAGQAKKACIVSAVHIHIPKPTITQPHLCCSPLHCLQLCPLCMQWLLCSCTVGPLPCVLGHVLCVLSSLCSLSQGTAEGCPLLLPPVLLLLHAGTGDSCCMTRSPTCPACPDMTCTPTCTTWHPRPAAALAHLQSELLGSVQLAQAVNS